MGWWGSVLVLLVLLGLALHGMRHGWRARARRTAGWVAAVPVRPGDLGARRAAPVEATYVSSTRAGEPLERVVAHDLGVRSAALVHVHDTGVLVKRTGAEDLFVPAADLRAVGTAPGMAGKVVGGRGLVVLTWQADGARIDTGLRLRRRADQPTLLAAAASLLAPAHPPNPMENRR